MFSKRIWLIMVLVLGMTGLLVAQVPPTSLTPLNDTGVQPFGVYSGVNELVNLQNGNLTFSIPLFHLKGRAGQDLNISLNYNSRTINLAGEGQPTTNRPDNTPIHCDWAEWDWLHEESEHGAGFAWGWALNIPTISGGTLINQMLKKRYSFIFTSAEGARIEFPYPYQGLLSDAGDASGAQLSLRGEGASVITADGTQYIFPLDQVNLTYNAFPNKIVDRSGNVITISQNPAKNIFTITDNVGRVVTVDSTNRYSTVISYPDSDGTTRSVILAKQTLNGDISSVYQYPKPFGNINTAKCGSQQVRTVVDMVSGSYDALTSITLNDGDKNYIYSFEYGTGVPGELTKVTYPTQGYTTFEYQNYKRHYTITDLFGNNLNTDGTIREVSSKHECDSVNSCHTTTYTYNDDSMDSNARATTIEGSGDEGAVETDYAFSFNQLDDSGLASGSRNPWVEMSRTIKRASDGRIYSKISNQYTDAMPRLLQHRDTILDDGVTTKSESFTYDSTVQNICNSWLNTCSQMSWLVPNIVSHVEFDFNGNVARETDSSWSYAYWNNDNTHYAARLAGLKTSETVLDANKKVLAKATYNYDETTPVASGNSSVGRVPGYTSVLTNRGYLTSIIKSDVKGFSPDNITTLAYDDAGNVVSVSATDNSQTPAKTLTTHYSYADNWRSGGCQPNGQSASYITEISNAKGQNLNYAYSNCSGLLTSATDLNGNATTFAYDALGRLISTTVPGQGSTTLQYDTNKLTTSVIGTDVNTQKHSYLDGLGRVTSSDICEDANCASALTTDFAYDFRGRKASASNPHRVGTPATSDGVTSYQYDPLNRITKTTNSDSTSQSVSYSGANTTRTDENSNQWLQINDALGRLIEVDEPNGASGTPSLRTEYGYDALNNLVSVIQHGDSSNDQLRSRTFSYDALSHLYSSQNVETGKVDYRYDGFGNLVTKTDHRGTTTTYSYDDLNRVISKTYNDGITPTSCYHYDDSSINASGTNLKGHITNSWTQPAGSACNSSPVAGSYMALTANLSFDTLGRPQSVLQNDCLNGQCLLSSPNTMNYTYDFLGNIRTYYGDQINGGTVYENTYDPALRLKRVTSTWSDARHPATLFEAKAFAPVGLQSVNMGIMSSGNIVGTTSLNYDKRGRVTNENNIGNAVMVGSPTNSNGSIALAFNEKQAARGTVSAATITITGQEQYVQGSIIYSDICDANNISICKQNFYDNGYINVMVGRYSAWADYSQSSTASSVASSLATSLNASGSPVIATLSGATISIVSKATGAQANYSLSSGSQSNYDNVSPSFNASPSGAAMSGGTNANPQYDSGTISVAINGNASQPVAWGNGSTVAGIAASLAQRINDANGNSVSATASGNVIALTSTGQGASTNYQVTTTITYDSTDFSSASLTANTSGMSGGQDGGYQQESVYNYSIPDGGYAANGNLLSVSDSVMGSWTYSYDTLNRLKSASSSSGQNGCWRYDSFGNRTAEVWQSDCSNVPQTEQFNSLNRVTVSSVNSAVNGFGYDDAGNVINDNRYLYAYDGEGRICAVYDSIGYSLTGYMYDANGIRVAKGSLNNFLIDSQGRLSSTVCNFSSSNFQKKAVYLLGPGGEQMAEFDGSGNWKHTNVFAGGKLIATYSGDDNDTYFNLTDWLGTKRAALSASGKLSTYFSLPYGNGLTSSGNGIDATEHHFTAKERDTESGNDYFGARYYTSSMGRWLSPDWDESPVTIPYADLSNPQTLNLYVYLSNNPLSRTDPTGHAGKSGLIQLGGKTTMRVDTGGADQVNVHVFSKNGDYRGRLNPDTQKIEWTKGAPPKAIAEDAQAYCLSKGKFAIAAAKKEMSVLGGSKALEEGKFGGSKLMEAGSWLLMALQVADIAVNAERMREINKMEGTTGFHLDLMGNMQVTNLQNFGDTFGVGAGVSVNGDVFRLNGDGKWMDKLGAELYQDQSGMHIKEPTA